MSARPSARDEDGYVIVVVLVILLVGLAFAFAALAGALVSSQSATRDARVRRAQQAADAGIQANLYQSTEADLSGTSYNLNGGPLGVGTFLDCVVPQLNASGQITGLVQVSANAAGVCPMAKNSGGGSVTLTNSLGNHTKYQAEMLTNAVNFPSGLIGTQVGGAMRELFPKIVSIGSETSANPAGSGTVYSREEAILAPIAPLQAVEGEHNVTLNGLQVCIVLLGCANLTGTLNGDVLARNNLTTPTALAGLNLSNGLFASIVFGNQCNGSTTSCPPLTIANVKQVSSSSIIQRQTVIISGSKPNCSNSGGASVTCSNALFSCTSCYSSTSPSGDTFSLASGQSATFTPGDYVFCNFSAASGSSITVSPTSAAPVRIFIDSPSSPRCANDTQANQGNFNDPAGFHNLLADTGGVIASSGMQVYVVGNGSNNGTTVQVGPTSTTGLLSLTALTYAGIFYAPTSTLTVNVPAACVSLLISSCTGGVFEGAAIGYDTTVTALTVTQDLNVGNFPLYAGINAYRPVQYVQCDNSVTSLTQATSDLNGC